MPPRYLRRASPDRLKHCQERTFETCDNEPTDGCCGVVPCKLCLEWEVYGDGIAYGSADFGTSSWTGTVGGAAFVAYWERNTYDECEFVVTFDGDEVYRATCYEGASCRNPAGEVSASIGYDEGTLRWSVFEPRELALIDDPDTGCRDFFCGDCRCSCDCLCVTITPYSGDVVSGEICDTSYPCDAPVWEGTVGYYDLSIALGRGQYGECVITVTSEGEEQEPVTVDGCADMSASVTLPNGDLIEVRCKQCNCEEVGCPDVPCDCEFTAPLACRKGTLVSTTIPGDTCAGEVVSGSSYTVPDADKKWVIGEDTPVMTVWDGFNITIPCSLDPLALVGVLVRRASSPTGASPYVDNSVVLPCEYYFVLYNEDLTSHTIHYDYELCCGQAEAAPPCTTRLSWIRFLGVPAGRGVYDFLFWSHSGSGFYPDGFQGNGTLVGECPFSDGDNPCL